MMQGSGSSTTRATPRLRVWDLWVRMSHWAVLGAVMLAATTGFLLGPEWLNIHVWAGTLVGALVLVRLVWGFTGGTAARFSQFVVGPRAVLAHLADLRSGQAHRHLGHNPLGAVMILSLLVVLAALVGSGAALLGDQFGAGPFAAWLGSPVAGWVAAPHQAFAWLLLGLVALHIAGTLYESRRSRENLVAAMITGDKDLRPGDVAPVGAPARPAQAVALSFGLLAALATAVAEGRSAISPRAPVQIAGSLYDTTCADCHAAFHPSLLPAASWARVMAGLGDHFGEDATIPDKDVAILTAYLADHAAGTAASKPSRVFQRVAADDPLRITASPFWQRRHHDLPDALFASRAVVSRSNCGACHMDAASGWFYPGAIRLPQEPQKE